MPIPEEIKNTQGRNEAHTQAAKRIPHSFGVARLQAGVAMH